MNWFDFDLRKLFVALSFVLIPMIYAIVQERVGQTPWYAKPVSSVSSQVVRAYSGFSSMVRGTTSLYLNLIDIKSDNRVLKSQNAELEAKLLQLEELKTENDRLRTLLNFKKNSVMNLLAAKVIGRDAVPEHQTVTLNRGTNHGVRVGKAVISVHGVVGYIYRANSFTSQVILVVDRFAAIDAIVQRSRARGIIEGRSPNQLRLSYLRRDDDVQTGDLIITSGLDGIFPKGFPIGKVTNVTKTQNDVSQRVDVEPSINPSYLEELFVVIESKNQDFEPLEQPKPQATNTGDPGVG